MYSMKSDPIAMRLHGAKSPLVLHTITAEEAGQRIDNFLMRHFKAVPRSRVYRLLRKGEVRVNRKRVAAEYRIAAGDEVRLPRYASTAGQSPAAPPTVSRSWSSGPSSFRINIYWWSTSRRVSPCMAAAA